MKYEADWDPATQKLVPKKPAPLGFEKPELTKPDLDQIAKVMDYGKKPAPMFAPADVVPTTPVIAGPAMLKIPGMKIRKRFEVTLEELRAANPDVGSNAFERAREALLVIDIDSDGSQFLNIGLEPQTQFSENSSKMLALSSNPKLDAINRGLAEIGTLLSAAELSQLFSGHTGWKSWFDSGPTLEEAKTSLKEKIREVQGKSAVLKAEIPQLYVLKVESDVIAQHLVELIPALERDLIVARFLVGKLQASPEKVNQLQRRVDSILMTRITLRQANLQLQLIQQLLRHLTETVNTALVNLIPAWCGNCVSFLSSIRQSQPPDKTALGALTSLRDDILKMIKEK